MPSSETRSLIRILSIILRVPSVGSVFVQSRLSQLSLYRVDCSRNDISIVGTAPSQVDARFRLHVLNLINMLPG